jgi:hypothetical protein
MTDSIAAEISKIREELAELEAHLPDWDNAAGNINGSKEYRESIAAWRGASFFQYNDWKSSQKKIPSLVDRIERATGFLR